MKQFYVTVSDQLQDANGKTATRFESVRSNHVVIDTTGALLFVTGDKLDAVYAPGCWLFFSEGSEE